MKPRVRTALAWLVHGYTALGLVLAALIVVLLVQGTPEAFHGAFLLLALAMAVDASDGWLARRVRVAEAAPALDGRRLDDIIDFHTYASLPLLLLWRAGIPGDGLAWVLLLPLLASAYGFSRVHAKTEDGYFLGFPSCWNVVAFYLYFLNPPAWLVVAILIGLSILVLIPSRYLNPGQPGPLSRPTVILGVVWGTIVVGLLLGLLDGRGWLLASLLFPVYYMVASWAMGAAASVTKQEGRSFQGRPPG